jgi:CDP-glucose 4,6-dehydratase
MREKQPEIVFHLAAQALVRPSYACPVETYSTNVMGTVNLLEAVRQSECVRVVIIVTTDKCYENREWLWGYRENDPLGGHDPYSSSKACAELVTAAYRLSYFASKGGSTKATPAVATVRAGNVIGGGDWAQDRLFPDIMRAIVAGEEAIIRNPNSIRPWQHVLEPLHGYLRLAERAYEDPETFSGPWNFGPRDGDARPVSWIVDELSALLHGDMRWRCSPGAQVHEANFLRLDSSKARSMLKWEPKTDLKTGLHWTVAWLRAYLDKQDLRQVTVQQITQFLDMEHM